MKTVSTKLNNDDFEKLQEMCNHDGQCLSESLRDMVKSYLEAYEDGLELEQEETSELKIIVEDMPKPKPMAHGKILDDYGNIVGTF